MRAGCLPGVRECSMAATRRGQRSATKEYRNSAAYVQGSAVRKTDIRRQLEEPRRQLSPTTRKNRERARRMNLPYVLFLSAAMAVTGVVLIGYIQMQSAITTSVKEVARLESELNALKTENDEALSRIESSIDLEEIRRIAISELGMTYAAEGQIVEIPDEGSDYVRQYAKIEK